MSKIFECSTPSHHLKDVPELECKKKGHSKRRLYRPLKFHGNIKSESRNRRE
jgi:hypothetical protein